MSAATQSIETNCANCAAAGDLHGGATLASITENGWTLLSAKIGKVTLMRPIHGNLQ